ncbi:hypothetical protein QBC43DRAFT_338356 [Cladorrhinum sp. PSN259]|nr:hypothetical protein QBC43DRAFT_338356 [Cladorrhinum sp. PSN259]
MENVAQPPPRRWSVLSYWSLLSKRPSSLKPNTEKNCGSDSQQPDARIVQVEDYPEGYPQYSALIAAYDPFHICRRFSNLRVRLLLRKQDKLSELEKQLEQIDLRASSFRGSIRYDTDAERAHVLGQIDTALEDYDAFVERNSKVLRYDLAKPRDVKSLQNWTENKGLPPTAEAEYLERRANGELVTLAAQGDDGPTAPLEA